MHLLRADAVADGCCVGVHVAQPRASLVLWPQREHEVKELLCALRQAAAGELLQQRRAGARIQIRQRRRCKCADSLARRQPSDLPDKLLDRGTSVPSIPSPSPVSAWPVAVMAVAAAPLMEAAMAPSASPKAPAALPCSIT